MHRIVVVGGGAGGLELVTHLGRRYGLKNRKLDVSITLVDINPTHVWKPLLHEIAAGSLDLSRNQLEYAAQAKWCGFNFEQGALKALNREERFITLMPVIDDDGEECLPERTLSYDTLVIAVGSTTNFFNVPGAETHSFVLDTAKQADRFRRRLMAACLRTQQADLVKPLYVTIIGAGATGVELAAELRQTAQTLGVYGLHRLDPQRDIQVTLVEAASRILPTLPQKSANATITLLHKLSIGIKCNAAVNQIEEGKVHFANGESMPSDLTVWAAGIKAPSILSALNAFDVNRQGQMIVHPTLQSVNDSNIFGLGDCVSCPWVGHPEGIAVPPRAQVAHQQASFLLKQFGRRLTGKAINRSFKYRDFGYLVSLGRVGAVGNIQDGVTTHGLLVYGWIARWMYASLYRLHIATLHGWRSMLLDSLAKWLEGSTRPRTKLH